jgi:hypothetical protein
LRVQKPKHDKSLSPLGAVLNAATPSTGVRIRRSNFAMFQMTKVWWR